MQQRVELAQKETEYRELLDTYQEYKTDLEERLIVGKLIDAPSDYEVIKQWQTNLDRTHKQIAATQLLHDNVCMEILRLDAIEASQALTELKNK